MRWESKHGEELAAGAVESPALFEYVIHYADGQSLTVPVRWKVEVGPWYTDEPSNYRNASVAWSGPLGKDDLQGVLYTMQWNNPRPDVKIETVDMKLAPGGRQGIQGHGAPVLMAITAASPRD
jgi:hypothetical protein